mmetsp:Transcript_3390/g.7320  ORF Transcript_3390/g.7320 Transcript_3390/m.7320 type:complete len:91 (+) Transcript_3390:2795-3067(+)
MPQKSIGVCNQNHTRDYYFTFTYETLGIGEWGGGLVLAHTPCSRANFTLFYSIGCENLEWFRVPSGFSMGSSWTIQLPCGSITRKLSQFF